MAALVLLIAAGFDWWWPIVLFLAFDLSMLGYAVSLRVGAVTYNLVHNYVGPTALLLVLGIVTNAGHEAPGIATATASWFFHVGIDRALGYGPRPSR